MSRLLACGLLLMLGGCNLLKKSDNADTQPSALPSASAVPVALPAIVPVVPAIQSGAAAMPAAPAVQNPAAGVQSKVTPSGTAAVATKGATASATGATVASAAPAVSAVTAVPSIPSLALPTLSAQCQSGCQKSYSDCTTQSGAANPVEMMQKCATALSSCFASCK